jgi:DNA-binding NarL/FixJ family response regulator
MNEPELLTSLMTSAKNQTHSSLSLDALSMREREVTLLAIEGLSNKAIARQLNVTEGTVKVHCIKSTISLVFTADPPLSPR